MNEEAVAVGVVGSMLTLIIVWYILQAIAAWKLFAKAGKPGICAFIPVVNILEEYDMCWNKWLGLLMIIGTLVSRYLSDAAQRTGTGISPVAYVLGIVVIVLHVVESFRLARSFGKGGLYGVFLLVFGPIARIFLGLGSAQYVGKE